MKITDKYYVLVRLGTTPEGVLMSHPETDFIYPNDEIGTDIKRALQCVNMKTARMVLEDYERSESGGLSSGFVPLLVTREYTF
jgi:hypothetical protein